MVSTMTRISIAICIFLVVPVWTFSQSGILRNSQQTFAPKVLSTADFWRRQALLTRNAKAKESGDDEDLETDESDLAGLDEDLADSDISDVAEDVIVVEITGLICQDFSNG